MKVGLLLLILHDVVEKLVGMNLLLPDGSFVSPTLEQDLLLVQVVESCAKSRGVVVKEEVDKIINVLPLVIGLVK